MTQPNLPLGPECEREHSPTAAGRARGVGVLNASTGGGGAPSGQPCSPVWPGMRPEGRGRVPTLKDPSENRGLCQVGGTEVTGVGTTCASDDGAPAIPAAGPRLRR